MAYAKDVISSNLRSYIKDIYKQSRRKGRRLRDALKEFVLDLSSLCIAYAPVPPTAPYSRGIYVNKFSMEADEGAHNSDKNSLAGGYTVPRTVLGVSEVYRLCSNVKTLPSVITVLNDVESDKGYEYSYNVEEAGWKYRGPYRPILRAILGALSKHPDIAALIDVKYSDGVSETIIHKRNARAYISDFFEGD